MDEIRRICSFNFSIRLFTVTIVMLTTWPLSSDLFSQQPRKIEIQSFDRMGKNDSIDPDLIIFRGNVKIKHNETIMHCDSAYHYDRKNQVSAWGHIKIEQGDTLNLFGDYLFYDGNTEKAYVTGNVVLIDKETILYTDVINYDVSQRTAYYDNQGRITNSDDELISRKGIYYANDKMFHFSEGVEITGPDYVITADTMNYNSESEVVLFTGPTEINGDSVRIFAHQGWYDTKNKISRIWSNAYVDNFQQLIEGDTLYYEEETGYGIATGNISITDTANNSVVTGNLAYYYKTPEDFIVTERAVYNMMGEKDTLYLHADTLRAVTLNDDADTLKTYRLIRAWDDARIYSHDFQSRSDSLAYSFRDSTIRMYGNPVLWSEDNQMTSDSLVMYTKNQNMDRMELYNGAFIISQVDSLRFNQIKGRFLTAYFDDNKLYRVYVEGNGESVFFLIEEDEMIGVNYSKSSNIEIIVEDGAIKEVTEFGNPDGSLDPPLLKNTEELKLQGFVWLRLLRPVDKNDIFREK